MKTSVVIPAAGLGKRIGTDIPKQFIEINNIPIIVYTIKLFDNIEEVESIIIPTHIEWVKLMQEIVGKFNCKKVKEVTIGGLERQDSIYSGIHAEAAKDSECILIHDSVRPFTSKNLIHNLIHEVEDYGAVIPALKPVNTIKEISNKGFVVRTLDREHLVEVQTPQIYWTDVVTKAYENAFNTAFKGTDSAALVEFTGYKVHYIDGEAGNIKITNKIDIEFAKLLLSNNQS